MAQAPWSAPAASAAHVRCAFSRVRGDRHPGAVGGAGALARPFLLCHRRVGSEGVLSLCPFLSGPQAP